VALADLHLAISASFAGSPHRQLGALFALVFFVAYPGYVAWTALGTLVAALRVRRRTALAEVGLVTNSLCLIGAAFLLWAAHTGRIRIHM